MCSWKSFKNKLPSQLVAHKTKPHVHGKALFIVSCNGMTGIVGSVYIYVCVCVSPSVYWNAE